MSQQPSRDVGSYPPPLFVAELDGGSHSNVDRHDGAVSHAEIYEMPADTVSTKPVGDTAGLTRLPKQGTGESTQANPWPYHGPSKGTDDEGDKAYFSSAQAPVAQEHKASASHHDHRNPAVSPVSLSEGHFFPAPLNIARPAATSPPPKQYKPYKPGVLDGGHGSKTSADTSPAASPPLGSNSGTFTYQPYRRPSYTEQGTLGDKAAGTPEQPASPGQDTAAPPYPMGMAPHHIYMPDGPGIPESTQAPTGPRPGQEPGPSYFDSAGVPASLAPASPPPHAAESQKSQQKEETALSTPPLGAPAPAASPPITKDDEEVLWPHPPGVSSHMPLASHGKGRRPSYTNQAYSPPAQPSHSAHDVVSPMHTGASSASQAGNYAPRPSHTSPPPMVSPVASPPPIISPLTSPEPATLSVAAPPPPPAPAPAPAPSQPGNQEQYPAHSTHHARMEVAPAAEPTPQSPPPAYEDIQPSGPSTQRPPEKASLFPLAPSSSAPHTPLPNQFHTQPAFPAPPGQPQQQNQNQPPPQPLRPSHSGPSSPMAHAGLGNSPAPYAHPPQQGLEPPPLPPRPGSSHANMSTTPTGFSANLPKPAAYPPPPKKHNAPTGHAPPSTYYQRPYGGSGSSSSSNVAYGSGKLFGSSAKKWLDKTNQLVEKQIGGILTNHPDPKYRPQPGEYGYQHHHAPQQPPRPPEQQQQQQHYHNQGPPLPGPRPY